MLPVEKNRETPTEKYFDMPISFLYKIVLLFKICTQQQTWGILMQIELQIFLKKEANYELLSKTMKIIGINLQTCFVPLT